jgi:ADP-ribose pyrophosphatase YjhB (NUDIX family)
MKETTLCFLLRDNDVLLAMKKRGFGTGKWNGVGGKLVEGEPIIDAAMREVKEEIDVDLDPQDLEDAGTLNFKYENNPEWDQECHLFVVRTWRGEPKESEEMLPQWFKKNDLPFEEMWIDDAQWLPQVLNGEVVDAHFVFTEDGGELLDAVVKIRD